MAKNESTSDASAFRPEITRRLPELPGGPMQGIQTTSGNEGGNKLVVGCGIVLSGQILSCEQLVVEGRVEAELENSQYIEISNTGTFKGSADIEKANISGNFEGALTVRGELTVRASGRVEGEIRYGKLCIETGGQIIGSVEALSPSDGPSLTAVTPSKGEDS